ncbi:MAG: hypothetical protein P8M30_17330 [Planctomycetaceae bacterium]|nr:hypothetical protein [Planctomycetaceae bacterium]
MKCLCFILLSLLFPNLQMLAADDPVAELITRWDAPEATQGIAVDQHHFYAIANSVIGKYDKKTGQRVSLWKANEETPLTHLNAGIIIDSKLYCASSNYPQLPEASSVEIFDTATLNHIGSHSFGVYEGSLTWVDQRDDGWWVVFAHYSKKDNNTPFSKPNTYTSLVKFDRRWRRTGDYVFPKEVLDRFDPHSCSGGSWGPGGYIYCTGHDLGELYQLAIPKAGPTLKLVRTIKVEITGQGIAWDRKQSGMLYGIDRAKRQVVVTKLTFPDSH